MKQNAKIERIQELLSELDDTNFRIRRIGVLADWAANKEVEIDLHIAVKDLEYESPEPASDSEFDAIFSPIDRILFRGMNEAKKNNGLDTEVFDENIDATLLLSLLSTLIAHYEQCRKKLISRLKYYGVKL